MVKQPQQLLFDGVTTSAAHLLTIKSRRRSSALVCRSTTKMKDTQMKIQTSEPVEAGNRNGVMPEFGRVKDVQDLFGVKRGIAYRWMNQVM